MQAFLEGYSLIIIYFVVCVSLALLLRHYVDVPREVFRKILHFILLGSSFIWVFAFSTWWMAALASLGFAIVIYPILAFMERFKGYSQILTERKSGEIKKSLLIVFTMFSIVITVCWGLVGEQLLVLACIFAWGFGDAAAALVGKRIGKHKLKGKYIEGKKSLEGTIAMFIVSFFSVFVILLLHGELDWYSYILVSIVTAGVSAVTELYTSNGLDTITCPVAAMSVLLPLVYLFGGIG